MGRPSLAIIRARLCMRNLVRRVMAAKTARPPSDLLGQDCSEQPDRAEARAGNHIGQPVHTEVDARPTDSDE